MSSKPIMEITAIKAGMMKSLPPIHFVSAIGLTATHGWKCPTLIPRVYITPPADGIQDIDFCADPPDGFVIQVPDEITAPTISFEHPPSWLCGFRIHAQHNSLVHRLGCISQPLLVAEYDNFIDIVNTSGGGSDFEVEEIEETSSSLSIDGEKCHRFTLIRLPEVTETKTVMKKRVLKVGQIKTTVTVPVIYHRKTTPHIEIEACWPGEEDIRGLIEKCTNEAVAAGLLAGLLNGNLVATAGTLTNHLRMCLMDAAVSVASCLHLNLTQRKHHSFWKQL